MSSKPTPTKSDAGDQKTTKSEEKEDDDGSSFVLKRTSKTIQMLNRELCVGCGKAQDTEPVTPLTDKEADAEVQVLGRQKAWEREWRKHSTKYKTGYLDAVNANKDLSVWAKANHASLCCMHVHTNLNLVFE